MLRNKGFEVVIASPPEYENLVAEIYYDGKFVLLVCREDTEGTFQVETPGPGALESEVLRRVDLRGLTTALAAAQERLTE